MPARRPRRRSGIVSFQMTWRKMPLTMSQKPAMASASSASRGPTEAQDRDAHPPADGRETDGRAVTPHARRPAARQRRHERADLGRRVEQAEHAGAAVPMGERREQGHGHAEEHGHHVDGVGADQLLPAGRVSQAGDHGPQARRFCVGRRRHGLHEREGDDRDGERGDVEGIGGPEAGDGDEHAAQHGAGDRAGRAAQPVEGARRHELVALNQTRQQGVERRPLQAVDAGHQGGDDEQQPEARVSQGGVNDEDARRHAVLVGAHEPTLPPAVPRGRVSAARQPGAGSGSARRRPRAWPLAGSPW